MINQHLLRLLLLFAVGLLLQVEAQPRECAQSQMTCCTKYMTFPSKYAWVTLPFSKQKVLCDAKTDYGGWLLIQRQTYQTNIFKTTYENFKKQIAGTNPCAHYWVGLDYLVEYLKTGQQFTLRIEIKFQGKLYYAEYENFKIDTEERKYALFIGAHKGNLTDSLSDSNRASFSASNKDHSADGCAIKSTVGWWYKTCKGNLLNGDIKDLKGVTPTSKTGSVMSWEDLTTADETAESVEMKVRREYP